ncbi:7327_t:CDS:2, partial [Gigaspora margarita]
MFPIDKQEEFPEAADFLRRTFLDIFDNNNSTDTTMMEIPKLNDGATTTVPEQDQTNIIY